MVLSDLEESNMEYGISFAPTPFLNLEWGFARMFCDYKFSTSQES